MILRFVVVIPVYNHPLRLQQLVASIRALDLPVILVDDGSDAITARIIDALGENKSVDVVRLAHNQGKGAAVLAGISRAREAGYTHALQIDADGQHDLAAVPALIAAAKDDPAALVSGLPRYDASIPKNRLYGRKFNHIWTTVETLSFDIKDAMCGFRVYPVKTTLDVAADVKIGARMDFDNDIMVRLYWRGVMPRFVPVNVVYPEDGISHFDLLNDNLRIIRMHMRLCLGMLLRMPRLLARKISVSRTGKAGSTSWAQQPERGSVLAMRFIVFLMRLLGTAPARALLHPITLYFFLFHHKARRASYDYLGRVHGHVPADLRNSTRPSTWNVYRHFYSFSRSVLVKLAAWQSPEKLPRARVHGIELLEKNLEIGRGMLFFSAHLGNLEICRALAARNSALKINALVYTRNAKKFSALMESVNPEFRDRLVLVEEIGADTAIRLRTLLEAGEIVVMVADRTPASENGRVVTTRFLGSPAPFATGPYVLAHLLECPVGLLFCLPDEAGGHEVFIEPFAERITLPRGERDAHLRKWTDQFAKRLEFHLLQHPLQWFNFYDFWAEATVTELLSPQELPLDG